MNEPYKPYKKKCFVLTKYFIATILIMLSYRNIEATGIQGVIRYEDSEDRSLKISHGGNEICVDPKYFPGLRTDGRNIKTNIFKAAETVTVYSESGCRGKSISFPLSHAESKCDYCWDSCHEKFDDGSDAHTNIRSVYIPQDVVAVAMLGCVGSFGYSDPGYVGVLEPGCQDLTGEFRDVVHFYFAAETSTPGQYEYIGKPSHPQGNFESQMSTEHWMYGPGGIENAQGASWYQYIFELLDPTKPRMLFQVGTGGTWLKPGSDWKAGDPCYCSPLEWPATASGETCNKQDLTQCTNGCCGTDGCTGLLQTMEGGSGYWTGRLPQPKVKWVVGSHTKCYDHWHYAPLQDSFNENLDCDKLGVIVATNRLLYPHDGISFSGDGMFGHAWINSPLGKTKNADKSRSIALILDTKNFKGPVVYMLPKYYERTSQWEDQNGNYHPQKTLANTGMNTGGGAFEWHTVPVYGHQGDERKVRLPNMQFPLNDGSSKSVLMSGAKSYTSKKDFFSPLNKAMKKKNASLNESKLLKLDSGYVHSCDILDTDFNLDFEGKTLELGATASRRLESDGMCSAVVQWDRDSPALNCNSTHCELRNSYRVTEGSLEKKNQEWLWSSGKLIPYQSMPDDLKGEYSEVFPSQSLKRDYDHRTPTNLCGSTPSVDTFYCRQTSAGDWIGWKWYKFNAQPGLQQMNYSKKEKRYLQRRITRLHKKMEATSPLNHWLKTPESMPELVTIDPKLIVDPPSDKKYGHVPIVTYQGMEKPDPCIVK